MNASTSDYLGSLRMIVHTLDDKDDRYLSLRCMSCERMIAVQSVADPDAEDPYALAIDNGFPNPHNRIEIPAGRYPLLEFSGRGDKRNFAVVLPFELRRFAHCLLHDLRAEWDTYCLSLRSVQVQPWTRPTKRFLTLRSRG